jgi:hypothetical protein
MSSFHPRSTVLPRTLAAESLSPEARFENSPGLMSGINDPMVSGKDECGAARELMMIILGPALARAIGLWGRPPAEQWIKARKGAIKWTRLSCGSLRRQCVFS